MLWKSIKKLRIGRKKTMDNPENKPHPGEIEEAKKLPNGHVYRIKGDFGPHEAVPPEAILGAWEVDANGNIVGDFIPNPNFKE